jgi:immune inhibitor A
MMANDNLFLHGDTVRSSPLAVILAIAFGLVICAGAVVVALVAGVLLLGYQSAIATGAPLAAPAVAPAPTSTLAPALEAPAPPASAAALEMEATLAAVELTPRDPVALAMALRGVMPEDIPPSGNVTPVERHVGDVESFWVLNSDTREALQIDAELVAETEHVYMWLDTSASARLPNGENAAPEDFLAAAERFEESYQILHGIFGEEPSPGVDGDVHLYVLNSGNLGAVGGFFSADDELPVAVNPMSNVHEMFYVSTWGSGGINGDYYNKTLAHEFQHMIHHTLDPNEDTWLNEGMSELAQQLAGLSGTDWVSAYLFDPGIQLTAWPPEGDTSPYYGGSFLMTEYLYERFGVDFITDLVRDPRNGLASLDEALADAGYEGDVDDVLDDWSVALVLDDPSLAGGRYGFENIDPGSPLVTDMIVDASWTRESRLNQYGFDYVQIFVRGPVEIAFTGDQTAAIVPVNPHSGDWMWWSNIGDYSMTTLTHPFDLSAVDQATLTFWTWYNIELEWDYAYVMVSTDDGQTWETLESPISTDFDPTGNNYGDGITGASEEWIQVAVDLSDYAGQAILLRFTLITDDSAHLEHMVIDDIAIPEIGFSDDIEGGGGNWVADGFVRIINHLPQHWSVQALVLDESLEVYEMTLDEDNTGTLSLDIPATASEAYLIVSPRTRYTLMPALYHVEMTR